MKTLTTLILSISIFSALAQVTSPCGTSIENIKSASIEQLEIEFKRLKSYNNPYCDTTNSDFFRLMAELAKKHESAKTNQNALIASMGEPYFAGTMTEYEELTLALKRKKVVANVLPPHFKIPSGRYYVVYLWREKDYLTFAFKEDRCVGYSWWELGDYERPLGFDKIKLLTADDWNMNVTEGKRGITGRVVDIKTLHYGQSDLEVGLYDQAQDKLATTSTDEEGRFEFRDVDQGDYKVRLEGDRDDKYSEVVIVDDLNVPYMFASSINAGRDGFFSFQKLSPDEVKMKRMEVQDSQMRFPFDLSNMDAGQPVVLSTVLFSSGSAKLLSSSYLELNTLSDEMKKHATVKIEITGHTDNTGNPNINKTLSEKRAKSVQDYLISRGISADRLTYKGKGHLNPMVSNDTESGRRQNRRVEFTVIK